MIDNYKDQLNYVPSKINYTDIQMASDGIYSLAQKEEGAGNSEAMDNLHALAEAVIDMENIIKNNFKLSEEKRTKFVDNNPVMTTLREELEQAFKDKKKLEELNQQVNSMLISNERKEFIEQTQEIDNLRRQVDLLNKDLEIEKRLVKNTNATLLK